MPTQIDRRSFLTHGAVAAGVVTVVTPLQALASRTRDGDRNRWKNARRGCSPDYGPLSPVRDETTGLPLLQLPAGFEYLTFGWTGDLMSDGTITPSSHDGMAAFRGRHHRVHLIRNHERSGSTDAFAPDLAYDPLAGGGTTTLEFDSKRGRFIGDRPSISGTVRNCAGGPTPWGSWLTCEETLDEPAASNDLTKAHGYIFDVPLFERATVTPLKAMGRFVHEAVAVDPYRGQVYETEDANPSGFYRFTPNRSGHLDEGGALHMLAIAGQSGYDTRAGQTQDEPLDVEWVPIGNPDPTFPAGPSVFAQGAALGGASFGRLEGAWWGHGKAYFVSTSGGNAGQGQIWEYDPSCDTLRLIFESPAAEVLNAPDNICVSPRGGLVLCEDGGGAEFIHGLTLEGEIFRFAQNNVVLNGERNGIVGDFRGSEFAGATFSPDGRWLFFNIQSPGITFAVTGPWRKGAI
jgi:secreted PhoX family phosphatase